MAARRKPSKLELLRVSFIELAAEVPYLRDDGLRREVLRDIDVILDAALEEQANATP